MISNEVVLEESRPGWILDCPSCSVRVKYTVLNLGPGPEPFLYCSACSNFVLRNEDRRLAQRAVGEQNVPTLDQLRQVYSEIERAIAPCPCGGSFLIWANVTCPHCGIAFVYDQGRRREEVRYFDSRVIWIEGATAFRGREMASNRLVYVDA